MAYFGSIFFVDMGGGGGQNCFQDKAFHLEVCRVSLLSSASKKGCAWEHGTLCKLQKAKKLLSSGALWKRRLVSKSPWGIPFCSAEGAIEHKALASDMPGLHP